MYTIKDNNKYELIIKNSKFITILYKITSIDDIDDSLTRVRKKEPDATHYCYGYIIDGIKKCSDDGEPSGTAGIPILKVLESHNLTNILCVVVRYFGGIKLGANGLIRAYTKSVSNAIKETTLCELVDGYNLDIVFDYKKTKEINHLLKDIKINSKSFDDVTTYNIDIPISFLDNIKDKNIKNIKDIKIEK